MKTRFNNKRAAAFLLTLCMLVTFLAPGAAAAGLERHPRVFRNSPLKSSNFPVGNVSKAVDWTGLTEYLYKCIKDCKTTIDVTKYKIPANADNKSYLSDVVYGTPKFLGMVSTFTCYYYPSEKYVDSIELTYSYSKAEFAAMETKCEKAVSKIIADIKSNSCLSDAEKVLLVHDRLACMCEYDEATLASVGYRSSKLPNEDHSAYGPLVLGTGVCDGYSSALSLCLEKLGIKSYVVSSDSMNHAWNIVYLNGEPYFVDATYDDPVWDISGYAEHDALLVSASKLKKDHRANDYPTDPVSTRYDTAYWTCSESAFQLVGDSLYYIDNENGTLCRRNQNGTSTVLKTLDYTWYSDANEMFFWEGNHSRLSSYAGRLIYSTPTEVWSYDVDTEETTLLYDLKSDTWDGKSIYGMTVKGEVLYIEVNDTPIFNKDTKAQNQIKTKHTHEHVKKEIGETLKIYCTDTGYTAGTVCDLCGKVFSGRTKIPPTAHVWGAKTLSVKATAKKDGKFVQLCENCPAKKEAPIPKVSGIKLSKTAFVYDGKVKIPAVTVKDSMGNTLPAKAYTVTLSNKAPKKIGTYTVTVQLKGNYTGSKVLNYVITPAQVKNLQQTKVTAKKVSLKWNASANAKYYQIQYSKDNGKTWKAYAVTAKTSTVVEPLKPGTKYQFRVCALDGTKKIAAKPSAALKTQTLCAAPTITSIKSGKAGVVTATWNDVAGATKYAISYSTNNGKSWNSLGTVKYSNVQLSNCPRGVKLYLKVRAINAYEKGGAFSAAQGVMVK